MRRIVSVTILTVFVAAASHPGYSGSFYKNTKDAYQNHLDWQAPFFNIKSASLGTTWNIFLEDTFRRHLQIPAPVNVHLNAFSCFWSAITTNAP